MAETMEKPDHDQYTVGWISALPLELAAARAMLDDDHGCTRSWDNSDVYNYHLGQIGVHNVVLACLLGMTGTVSAAAVAAQMSRSFPSIRFGFMVGIGGGVPSDKNDIRLGDVVVSKSAATFGGVVQYDFGRRIAGGKFERTGSLNKPPQVLRSTLSSIEAEHLMYPPQLQENLRQILQKKQPQMQESYSRPYQEDDLYRANYNHVGQDQGCSQCDKSKLKPRPRRSSPTRPKIHYGTIASGNSTIMDGISRDKLIEDPDSVLCVEKEAAGLMDDFPCLVIRGICDYADSHKNKEWQNYAAAIAATYTKLFLIYMPKKDVEKTVKIQAVFLSRQNSPGLGQPSTTQAISYPNQSLPEQRRPSQQRSITSSSQYQSGLLQSHTPLTISPSNQSIPMLRQPPIQQGTTPSNQSRPGLGRRPAHSTPVLSAGVVSPTHLQPRHAPKRSPNSDPVLVGHKKSSQKPDGIQQKMAGSQPGQVPGYKHPSEMIYPQPPKMSHFRHRPQHIHNDPSSPIPLHPVAGLQHELVRPSTPGVTYPTATEFSGGDPDMGSEDEKAQQPSLCDTSCRSSSEASAAPTVDVVNSPNDNGGMSTSTLDPDEDNGGEENGHNEHETVDNDEGLPSEMDDGENTDNCDCCGCFDGCCNDGESDQDEKSNCCIVM